MNTTQTYPFPVVHRLGRVLHLLRQQLVSLLQHSRASATATWQDDALDPQDLLREPRGFSFADEYKRRTVDKVMAACPHLRM